MRNIEEIKNNVHKMKVAKWFGCLTFILFMYATFQDFGLLAALVLIYIFVM